MGRERGEEREREKGWGVWIGREGKKRGKREGREKGKGFPLFSFALSSRPPSFSCEFWDLMRFRKFVGYKTRGEKIFLGRGKRAKDKGYIRRTQGGNMRSPF